MTIYFTSDLHLGHANVIPSVNRPFGSVDEMNHTLIENINSTVKKDDELWILGDFSFKIPREEAIALRNQICCPNVHLVYGNHDKNYDGLGVFSSTQDYKQLRTEHGKVILFHYPIADWNSKHHGSVYLHGHIHSTGEYNKAALTHPDFDSSPFWHHKEGKDFRMRRWDVGVDANGFRPVSLDEIWAHFGIV